MSFHVFQTIVDAVDDVEKLLACRRKCWILKALREMLRLRKVLETKANIFADFIQLTLLLNEVLAGCIQG